MLLPWQQNKTDLKDEVSTPEVGDSTRKSGSAPDETEE